MEPATIGLVSSGVGAAGSLISGFSQNAQANRQADVADANAQIATDQAAADAAAIRSRGARVQGAQRASSGASGIAGTGFADAMSDSAIMAEKDAQTALYNGRIQATNAKAEAAAARTSGRSALLSGALGAGTRALSGYGQWKMINARVDPYGYSYSG